MVRTNTTRRSDGVDVQNIGIISGTMVNLGYQQITSVGTAVALTVPNGAMLAVIQCEGQAVRWRDDGTNPTTTVGMRLALGAELEYDGDLSSIKFIEELTAAKLNVTYYG